jgi:hypothetical protein
VTLLGWLAVRSLRTERADPSRATLIRSSGRPRVRDPRMSCRCHTLTAVAGSEAAALSGLNAPRRMVTERGVLVMEKLGQLLRTTWKRLLTLRMVAWSPGRPCSSQPSSFGRSSNSGSAGDGPGATNGLSGGRAARPAAVFRAVVDDTPRSPTCPGAEGSGGQSRSTTGPVSGRWEGDRATHGCRTG